MKNFALLLFCVVCVVGCSPKRPAVVEHPVFDVWNSNTLEIDKIEMSDSATILSIRTYGRHGQEMHFDNGFFIRESDSDEKLLITNIEGINFGETFVIPESGEVEFKLFFPPLKPEVTKIDLIEGDCNGCSRLFGIRLLSDDKVEIAPAPPVTAEELPEPAYSRQPARINGQLFGYVKGALMSDVIDIHYLNPLTFDHLIATLPIADDGSFSGELLVGIPCIINAYPLLGNLFLAPGKETKIVIDLNKRSRYLSRLRTDKAPGDSIFAYQSGCGLSGVDVDAITNIVNSFKSAPGKFFAEIVNMKPNEYKEYLLSKLDVQLNQVKQSGKSENVQLLMESAAKFAIMELLLSYESLATFAYQDVNQIFDEKEMTFKAEKPGEDYYSFLSGMLDDRMSYLPDYPHVAVRIFILAAEPDQPTKEKYAETKEKITKLLGTDQGILFDLVRAQLYGKSLFEKLHTDAEQEEIKAAFVQHPEYSEALIAESNQMKQISEDRKNNNNVAFDTIMLKYKGKVVLVDFWATWCGPCMSAMKSILPLKEEMKEKDVVFLYLTGETSPLAKWNSTIPTIHGEHYRLSDTQWSYLLKVFQIHGIPHYQIYDKQGKQTYKTSGFPGVETMKAEIEKVL